MTPAVKVAKLTHCAWVAVGAARHLSDARVEPPPYHVPSSSTRRTSHDRAMRWNYARTLYEVAGATLDDLREAATRLEDTERIARRVLGCRHPTTAGIEKDLQKARETRDAHSRPAA